MLLNNTMENGDEISVSFSYEGDTLIAYAKIEENGYILTKCFTKDAAELISEILCSPDMEKGGVSADYFHKDRKRMPKETTKAIYRNEVTLDEDELD